MTSQELTKGTTFLLKSAKNNSNSSWLGRYANMTSLPYQQMMDKNPKSTFALNLPAVASPLLQPLSEMAMKRNSLGGTTKERRSNLDEADQTVQDRSYGQNMHALGKNWAGPTSLLGGVLGAGFGASTEPHPVMDGSTTHYGTGSRLGNAALGGLGGAAIGGLAGYLGGGLNGAINKLVSNSTSTESTDRAKKMVAKHPYLTSLPFGNMIGAAFA